MWYSCKNSDERERDAEKERYNKDKQDNKKVLNQILLYMPSIVYL